MFEFTNEEGTTYTLLTDDEMPKYLTIDEMKELVKDEPYKPQKEKFLHFQKNEKNGLLKNIYFLKTFWRRGFFGIR